MPVQCLPGNAQLFTEITDSRFRLTYGRPLFRPRARAETNPSTVRSEMSSRSNSERAYGTFSSFMQIFSRVGWAEVRSPTYPVRFVGLTCVSLTYGTAGARSLNRRVRRPVVHSRLAHSSHSA